MMRLYLFAAFTTCRPSHTVWLSGFSQYTSLPACAARIAISECM